MIAITLIIILLAIVVLWRKHKINGKKLNFISAFFSILLIILSLLVLLFAIGEITENTFG